MKGTASKNGFGMAELMAAMLATSILAITVGSILVYAWKGWVQSSKSVEMQRDASLAMRIIAKAVRQTPIGGITEGSTLTCVNSDGTFVFSRAGKNLNYQLASGDTVPLVRGILANFNTTVSNRAVIVELDLGTGSDSSDGTMTVFSRN